MRSSKVDEQNAYFGVGQGSGGGVFSCVIVAAHDNFVVYPGALLFGTSSQYP